MPAVICGTASACVLWDAGVRIGEALGLRHEDIASPRLVHVGPDGSTTNRARSKSREQRPCRSARRSSACMPTTCTPSTGTWIRTTCSSTCGPGPRAARDFPAASRPGDAAARRDRVEFRRTGSGTRPRPGCCARGAGRGSSKTPWAFVSHHTMRVRPSDCRGRPRGAGGGGLVTGQEVRL